MLSRARIRLSLVAAASALVLVSVTAPAGAEPLPGGDDAVPTQPATAGEARAAWRVAEERAALLNDQVLQAGIEAQTAAAAATAAEQADADAARAVADAEVASAEAQVLVDDVSARLSTLANASFRAGRPVDLTSLLLSAKSPTDVLAGAALLERVASVTAEAMEEAEAARGAAAAKAIELAAARAAAQEGHRQAVAARDAASAAQREAAARQSQFADQVAEYQSLYDELTEAERLAAIAAEEDRLAAEAAARAAANPDDPVAAVLAAPAVAAPAVATPTVPASTPEAIASDDRGQVAVAAALSKVGSRYVWGASGPSQFDCSGLTSWAWKQAGVVIPRTSRSQAQLRIVPLNELRPGDLITYYSPVSHIAMYIGNGQIVQASTASKPVYVTTIAKGGPNPVGHRVG